MTNWKDFFNKYLVESNYYRLDKSYKHGDTDIEIYLATDNDVKTYIKIGYLDEGELIFFEILNPETFGHNKYQEQEYFCRFDFTPGQSYGPPGLDFNEININAIKDLLKTGIKGKEIQYYKDDLLIKSIVYLHHIDSGNYDYSRTIWFSKDNIFKRISDQILGRKIDYLIKEISLDKVFKGLNIND